MENRKELMEIYTYLAAYKRQLGVQMEEVEAKLGNLEQRIGLSRYGAMEMRAEGTDLFEKAECI